MDYLIANVFNIFIVFFVFSVFLQWYLSYRRKNMISAHFSEVPEEFKASISLEEHQKAAKYTIANIKLANIDLILQTVVVLIFIFGGLNYLASVSTHLFENHLFQGVALILLFLAINWLISLPLTVYRTFKTEADFGFNHTTQKTFITDQIKGIILTLVISVPLLLLILFVMNSVGSLWWLYVWLIWLGFSLLLMWIFPKWIAPIFNKFEPLTDESFRSRIENLLARTGFKSNGIFVMDGSKRSGHGNAYFTGVGKNKRIVFFDTLLKDMKPEEVEAVLAHELGHFKRKHIIKQMIVTFLLSLVMLFILGLLINLPEFYTAFSVTPENKSHAVAFLLFFMILPYFTFIFSPLGSIFSRKNEYEADEFAAKVTNGQDLISALIKLYSSNASSLVTDYWYSFFYDSHPNAKERIDALKRLL